MIRPWGWFSGRRALAGQVQVLPLDNALRNLDAGRRFDLRPELPRLLKARWARVIHATQDCKDAMTPGQRNAVKDGGILQHHAGAALRGGRAIVNSIGPEGLQMFGAATGAVPSHGQSVA